MARRPQGTSGHEICGRWCIYGKYIQPWASRGGEGVFKNPDFCGESFSQTQKEFATNHHSGPARRHPKTPRDACDACRRAKVSGLGVSLLTARGRHTQHSSPAPRSPHPQPNHSPTRLKGCSCSRPSLCQHAGTDVDGWLPPDPDPRRVPAHQCPPSTATLCIDRPGPRSNPRMYTALRVLVPLLLCGAATMVVKTASFGAARRLLAHTPNPIQPPHCPTHCPTGPKNCPVSFSLSPQCSLVLV